jgi:hypothetical protein
MHGVVHVMLGNANVMKKVADENVMMQYDRSKSWIETP